MKKIVLIMMMLMLVLSVNVASARDMDISIPSTLVQSEFDEFVKEFGVCLSFNPMSPAEPLAPDGPGETRAPRPCEGGCMCSQ